MNQQLGVNSTPPLIQRPQQLIQSPMAGPQAFRPPQATPTPQAPQPHPLFQGRDMAHQMPPTPHSGAVHQLLQHAIPIYHQINAIKKALGTGSAGQKNNPGGVAGF